MEWQSTGYGEYYARSADVYAAVKLRAEAASRPPLQVREVDASGAARWVGPEHPVQRLLDTVNGWWSRSDLLIATETYLCLWGAAFWYLGRSAKASPSAMPDEIWALRPDRVRVVRDPERYVAGFVYEEHGWETALLPEEVVWFRSSVLMFSESVLANWPAEMSNAHHGECDFDSKGTDKTSGSEQFAR